MIRKFSIELLTKKKKKHLKQIFFLKNQKQLILFTKQAY